MFRFKKAGSFLSILTVVAVVAGTFPIQAWAEVYTGELQLPNTTILPDYRQSGGGQATLNKFNNSYFPSAPSFTLRDSNNFITSLPQKIFSASIRDGALNCTGDDINLNAANSNIVLTGIGYNNDENSSAYSFLCQPIAAYPTTQNTILNREGSGNSHGGLGVVQTYDALPVLTLGEAAQTTTVESIPNDPNNVRVAVSENVTQEVYGMHFERRGDVWNVISGRDWSPWYEDYNLYKDGTNYIISWTSNWVGQMSVPLNDDYGTVIWGDPSTYSCDYETGTGGGRCTMDPLYVNTGYPTPQIIQLALINPSTSETVIRPRNSDVVGISQPQCTRWTDGNFWRTVQHVYCITYGLSADGRYGHADFYDSSSSSGWFQDFLGLAITFASLASGFGGADFGLSGIFSSTLSSVIGAEGVAGFAAAWPVISGVSSAATLGAMITATVASVAAISGPSALGTVESSGGLGVGAWTWSQAPVPTVTTNTTTPMSGVGAPT